MRLRATGAKVRAGEAIRPDMKLPQAPVARELFLCSEFLFRRKAGPEKEKDALPAAGLDLFRIAEPRHLAENG